MIVLLNPVFNCSKKNCSEKVTTGTYNFVSFILNVAFVGEPSLCFGLVPSALFINLCSQLVITQFTGKFKVKDTSQLINGISSVLQKLPTYYNGTAISTSFVPSLFAS